MAADDNHYCGYCGSSDCSTLQLVFWGKWVICYAGCSPFRKFHKIILLHSFFIDFPCFIYCFFQILLFLKFFFSLIHLDNLHKILHTHLKLMCGSKNLYHADIQESQCKRSLSSGSISFLDSKFIQYIQF